LNPGDAANKANRWGVLKIEKQQMQLLTQHVYSKTRKDFEGTRHEQQK